MSLPIYYLVKLCLQCSAQLHRARFFTEELKHTMLLTKEQRSSIKLLLGMKERACPPATPPSSPGQSKRAQAIVQLFRQNTSRHRAQHCRQRGHKTDTQSGERKKCLDWMGIPANWPTPSVCWIEVKVAVLSAHQYIPWKLILIKFLNNFWYFKVQMSTRICSEAYLKHYWRNCILRW